MTKRLNWKTILLTLLLTTLILLLLITVYVATVVSEISNYNLNHLAGQNRKDIVSSLKLEAGSLVRKNDLQTYYNFSATTPISFNSWLKIKKNQQHLSDNLDNQDILIVTKGIDLQPLIPNECKIIYCYQHQIPFESIPSILWKGLIGIEDYRFIRHFGIDFKSIARALITDIIQMRLAQGGSTLTQQLAKNLFLTNKRTIERKIREIIYSIYIELNFTKEQILEAYFNNIFWGAFQGIRTKGIYAASIFYFDKRPGEITPYEAAILIAMLKGPNYYHPLRHQQRLQGRTKIVFNKLVSLNLFAAEKSGKWDQAEWNRWSEKLQIRNARHNLRAIWSIHHQTSPGQQDHSLTLNQFEHFILNQSIYGSLAMAKKNIPKADLAAKVIIGKPFNNKAKPHTFYSKLERNQLQAITKEKHQIGSIIKPIVYSIFYKLGITSNQLVSTEPLTLNLLSGDWSPREAGNNFPASATTAQALQRSYNRPVIRLAQEIGFEQIQSELIKYISNLNIPLSEYPAQLLGAVEMSPMDIYHSYQQLLRNECEQVNNQNINFEQSVVHILSNPNLTTIRRKVDRYLNKMSFMGKTGTSNNGLDTWFVFFDGSLLGVIWIGMEGKRGPKVKLPLSGGSTAFPPIQRWLRERGKQFNQFHCPQWPIQLKKNAVKSTP